MKSVHHQLAPPRYTNTIKLELRSSDSALFPSWPTICSSAPLLLSDLSRLPRPCFPFFPSIIIPFVFLLCLLLNDVRVKISDSFNCQHSLSVIELCLLPESNALASGVFTQSFGQLFAHPVPKIFALPAARKSSFSPET